MRGIIKILKENWMVLTTVIIVLVTIYEILDMQIKKTVVNRSLLLSKNYTFFY